MGVLLGLYYLLPWGPLQRLLGVLASVSLSFLGHEAPLVVTGGAPMLVLRGTAYELTANCTYADLVLCGAPFAWRGTLSVRRNLLRLLFLSIAVLCLDVARVSVAIHLAQSGYGWSWAHDGVDVALHASVLSGLVVSALSWDRQRTNPSFPGANPCLPQ